MSVPYTKCGKSGDTVWQRNRYGQISYPYHIPANPKTAAQRLVRGNFGVVSARWRTLTEEQRQVWLRAAKDKKTRRRLGKSFRLGGFNYFVRVNVALANRGLPQVDLPPEDGPQPGLSLPLLTRALPFPCHEFLIGSPHTSPQFANREPPPSG